MSGKLVVPPWLKETTKSITILLAIFVLLVIAFSVAACNPVITRTPVQQLNADAKNTFVKQPDGSPFKVLSLAISPTTVEAGQPVTVMADIINLGDNDEAYKAELLINDIVEVTKNLTIPRGATQRINFLVSKNSPGNYIVTFGDMAGNFAITNKTASAQINNNSQSIISTPSCCDPNQTSNSGSSCCGTPPVPQYSTQSSSIKSGGSCCGN